MSSYQCCLLSFALIILSEITFFGVLGYVTQPELRDLSNGHTMVDEDITLECTVTSNRYRVTIQWEAPLNLNLTEDRVNISSSTEYITPTLYTTTSVYTISQATLKDKSVYYCRVADAVNPFDTKYEYIWVPVYGADEHLIEFHNEYTVFDKASTELRVRVQAHPEITFQWIDNNNKTISQDSKFATRTASSNRFTNYEASLAFNTILLEDFGNYTLIAANKYENKSLVVPVNITGAPPTSLKIDRTDDEFSIIKCQSAAYPKPVIHWQFLPCNSLSCFDSNFDMDAYNSTDKEEFRFVENGLQMNSYVAVNKSDVGLLQSISENSLGEHSSIQHIYKVESGFEIYADNIIKNGSTLVVETLFRENIELMCAVSLDSYHKEIKWYTEGRNLSLNDGRVPIKGFDEYNIKSIDAVYSSVSIVKINIDTGDQVVHSCKASTKDGRLQSRSVKILAREQPTLNVASNMQNKTVQARLDGSWKFFCNVDGYPTPSVKWFKNNATIKSSKRAKIRDNNQTLALSDIQPNDNGTYMCVVTNRLNMTTVKRATLQTIPAAFDALLVGIICLVLILAVVIIFIVIKLRKERKLKKELELMGLANFETGAVEYLNPDLRLDDQVELLPYDKKWEIPAANLTLGKELGSGAFGVVVKGEIRGFPDPDTNTTVAVKMVNKFAGHDCIKALASELKIMVHLGQHINIVNLLGACTQEITKRKLLVIVEYCPFGSLHEYILYRSNHFVDQRKPSNQEEFDWTITPKKESRKTSEVQYTTVSFSKSDDSQQSIISTDQDNELHKIDYEKTQEYITSHDFLVWSFQIAKGMEYLASRRVLHGDLAARNVLLSDDNVIKISDFGLARSMYKSEIYKKKENAPLPVKWMAIESIGEQIFSTQSDVWSFGVVLWELFSLAKTPYPGMQVDQSFYKELVNGYRMEKPELATTEIYQIMLDCWNSNPTMRPTFSDLAEKLGKVLEEPVKNHYLDMNSCYVLMKKESDEEKQDYLLMMSPPNFENIVPSNKPFYVNNISFIHSSVTDLSSATDKTNQED